MPSPCGPGEEAAWSSHKAIGHGPRDREQMEFLTLAFLSPQVPCGMDPGLQPACVGEEILHSGVELDVMASWMEKMW